MAKLSYQKSNILWLWIQSVLYGIYIPIFSACIYVLAAGGRLSSTNKRLLMITVILFTITSVQTIGTFVDIFLTSNIAAPVQYAGETPAIIREKDVSNFFDCVLDALNATNIIFADGLLIWRCYMVWGRSITVIIVPIIMLAAGSACGYTLVYFDSQFYLLRLRTVWYLLPPQDKWTHFERMYEYMSIVYYSTSLVTNLLMSSLIAYRIWRINKDVRIVPSLSGSYKRIALSIVETGAIYSACLLIAVIYDATSDLTSTEAMGVSRSVVVMISGIAPTLLIVLTGLKRTTEPTTQVSTGLVFHGPSTVPILNTTEMSDVTATTPMRDLEMKGESM
ncbi:hypothetical protein NEOLEDRAFT_1127343 [Neolentinus lepideus HHB14362 ss-1]|uniref:Fungal pheromone STE3G-protein-coupled receptor n=1 Tax=Neolentinus lepideus HHB14362 ss-1 TaxID=1314782 RepID=A0A165VG14_9AGAM|nr:hypothetical protein NEOLEDRAFT_1127343 [Neolentinus lepideus HHB14362 ss-1]